ncbi:MAG: WYL domain-containing protein [Desulfobacteraceae bacterium]|nr:MAG: WYL domain-containing protein [Desulfobacteraceae bacterium]
MRGKNLLQLIKALTLLSRPQGCTRKELAEELDITDRSVSRLLNSIETLNIPIYDEQIPLEKQKRWHIESSYVDQLPNLSLPKIALTFPEIISLCMMVGESVVFKGTEIDRHIQTALSSLMYFIPEETRIELSGLKRIFISKTIGSKRYTGKEKIITTLTESILNGNACEITYHVFYNDRIKDDTIGPLHLYENNGGLYLFAVKLSDNQIRSYAVERIKRITALPQSFDYPADFDPEQTLNSAFDMIHGEPITVKIRFSSSEARYIKEKQWAKTQTIEDHEDDSITLTMTTSGYRDVKRWVMSFGKEAVLLEPEKMKQEIRDEIQKILSGD